MNHFIPGIHVLLVGILILAGCAGPTTVRTTPNDAAVALEAQKQKAFALREALHKHDPSQNPGWPVLMAGVPLCVDRKRWAIGAFYANKFDFPQELQDTAVALLNSGDVLQVLTVAQHSPADTAGLKQGDAIISVNGKNMPVGKNASKEISEVLKKEFENGKEADFVVRNMEGLQQTLMIKPVEVCDYPLALLNQDEVNAFADGNNIFVNTGMMDFARTDQELSLVLAHELSHNAMRHIDARKTNFFIGLLFDILVTGITGVDVGIRNAAAMAYSKEFEAEADYVGLYIMQRAGIPLDNSADFWRRMSVNKPDAINKNYSATHPSTPERFVAIEDTIKEIDQKIASNTELMPNINEDTLQQREPAPRPESQLSFAPK